MYNKTKEKKKPIHVIGVGMFDNGKLIMPSKKKKTAQQLLEENPMSPKLKREITMIENKFKEETDKTKQNENKKIEAKTILLILAKIKGVTSYHDGSQNVVKYNKKTICWVADRKYGFSVSTWDTGGKNFKTIKVTNDKEIKDILEIIKTKGGIIEG